MCFVPHGVFVAPLDTRAAAEAAFSANGISFRHGGHAHDVARSGILGHACPLQLHPPEHSRPRATVALMSQTKCWTAWATRGFPAGWIDRLGARGAESRLLERGVRRTGFRGRKSEVRGRRSEVTVESYEKAFRCHPVLVRDVPDRLCRSPRLLGFERDAFCEDGAGREESQRLCAGLADGLTHWERGVQSAGGQRAARISR